MTELKDQLQRTLGDNYTIERELGGAGMSRVFVAEEVSLGRKVVVKVLPPELAATVNLERFRREIQLEAKLQHPHIVPVLAAGVSDGLPYYTMPFIEGESLRTRLARKGELPIHDAANVLRDVLSALSYAHEHGVVHRDIKPGNILLTGSHAVVADFGVAKALSASTNRESSRTSFGVALGTPAYMAPEQAAADPTTDHRADIYAVGAVAYEMLTGQEVFSTRSPQAMLAAHATEAPEPIQKKRASVPPALASLIMRSLEKRAADRPQSAGEMLAELEASIMPSGATTPHTGMMPAREVASSRRSTWMTVGAAVLLLLLGSSSIYWRSHRAAAAAGAGAMAAGADSAGAISSVAVIPFVNMGGTTQDEYFSDGMTDELAHALSRLPQLHVAGRTSSYAFKSKNASAQEIGKTLNVAAVVEGSIRRAGDRLRVIAQLTSAADGRVVWSDSYESNAKDVFQVQDEFTKAIVGALAPALGGQTHVSLASANRGTEDETAYELYLKGRYFFLRRGDAGLRRAIGYFSQAVARDPKFARAEAGISMAYSVLPGYSFTVSSDSVTDLALAAAKRAIAADSTVGDAHLALANALGSVNPEQAEVEFQKALSIQPEDATTHQWHGDNLENLGRPEDGLAEELRAQQLDPLAAVIGQEVAFALYELGRFDESVRAARKSLEIDSTFSIAEDQLGLDFIFLRKPDSALAVMQRSMARDPHAISPKTRMGVFAAAGRWADANRIRLEVEQAKLGLPARPFGRLLFGDLPGAFAAFEQFIRNGSSQIIFGCDPMFGPLKKDPRFAPALARVGAKPCQIEVSWPFLPPPPQFALKK